MPVSSTTAGTVDALMSTTLQKYAQKSLEDEIFDDLPFFYILTGRNQKGREVRSNVTPVKKGKRMIDGGESIVVPLMIEANSTAGSYNGSDPLDITLQDGITTCQFSPKQYSVSIGITGREEHQNAGSETKMLDLLKAKTQQAQMSLSDKFSQGLWSDGTGNNGKDITGVQAAVANTPTSGTYAGINRGTYTWWRNQYQNSMGSFAAGGPGYMRTMYNNCSRGQIHPQALITTQAIHEYYEDSQEPTIRRTNSTLADAGFQNIEYRTTPVLYDLDCPSGAMYFFNFDFMELAVYENRDFATTDFIRDVGQDVKVAQIMWMGNLTLKNCRFQGIITGITA